MGDILKSTPEALGFLIGLLFILILLAFISSLFAEVISRNLRLRSKTLEEGVRNLLGGELARSFYSHPLIRGFARANPKNIDKPAYLPSRVFSSVLLDIVSPEYMRQSDRYSTIRDAVFKLADFDLRRLLSVFLEDSGGDLKTLQKDIEFWFESAMSRMSVRYQRKIQTVLFIIGFAVSIALNADAIMMANTLSTAPMVKSAISQMLQKEMEKSEPEPQPKYAKQPQLPRHIRIRLEIQSQLQDLSILGWSSSEGSVRGLPRYPLDWVVKVLGFLITAFAVAFIAPILFDLLSKLVNLRGAESRYT